MTAKPQKSCQFKRDYPQLINLYPPCALTTAQSLDNFTRLRRSRLTTPSAQLGQGLCVMGQWGLGDGLELLYLLQHWQTQTQNNTRLLVKVFEPNPINDYELKLLWDQSQSLISQPHLQPIADAILKAKPARIIGCQRLIFDDGRITVDLHFGDLHTSLTNLPHSPAHPIQQWLVLPHLALQL
ncbi:MAG: FAD-dependent cmnm(5)s(2)U34 oxidoreductase, partial [Shewanella sp.]